MHASSNNSHRNYTNRILYQKKPSNQSMALCIPRDTFHELFWVSWDTKNHRSIDFLVEYPVCVIPVAVVNLVPSFSLFK